ncbi:MAG: glycosyltransferase, partial [Rhodoferax sp.]|nr:glycosyltransferase [Rhodoferax sp.]
AELGFEVHVAMWLSGVAQDNAIMQQEFGPRFHGLPYEKPLRRRESLIGKWVRRARQLVDEDARYTEGVDDWYDDRADPILRRLDAEIGFDIAIAEYVFMSRALLALQSPRLKLIDAHDLFANRHRLFLAAGATPQFFSTSPAEERRGLLRADVVLGIQPAETAVLNAYSGVQAMTFGHTVHLEVLWARQQAAWDLLMVGSSNQMNVEGMLWFGNEVMPLLLARMPGVRVAVVGGVCKATPDFAGVTKLGIVPDLQSVYATTRLAINPVRSGTGLNIKSVEALGYGLPLLTTQSGCRGLEAAVGQGLLVADTPAAFVDAVAQLLPDPAKLHAMSASGYAFAARWNDEQQTALVQRLQAAL